MAKKEKIYVRSLITNDILLGTPDGPVRLFIDSDKRLSIDLDDNSGQNKSIKLDPDSKKIVVDEITFQDGSSLSLSNNLIPSEKISEIPESKLSSDLRSKINSSNSAINSYFDENGKLKENNTPTDYSEIRAKANDSKTIADTLSGFFDDNNKLKTNNLADSVVTTINFNDTFDTRFNSKNPITTTNFETELDFDTRFNNAFNAKNAITTTNFEDNFDNRFNSKNPITTINFATNFDTAFASKNTITIDNFSSSFDAAFIGKNAITTANFDTTLDFDTRFNNKNPITTTNFSSNFDTAFTGKNPITTANFGSNFDTAFTGKNPVTTGIEGNFDDLFDGKVPTGYETWNALAINATNGNEALSKFSGAGGKLPIDGVIPPGDYTGWGEINTDIAKGISADSDLNGLDFSIDNSDPNNPIVKINKGGSRGFATNTIGKSSIGLGNVANESPTTIRQGITIDENGALQGIGNGSGTTISNNRVTLQLAGQTLTFNNGTSNPILLDSGNVGLGNVENKSSTDIRNEIQIVNGVLNGIGTSGIVVNNASIGLSRDPTSGEITLDKGVGTPVTVNPFTATRFTEVSGVAESALTNAAAAQSTADSANTTATTVRGFFTDIPDQTPQLNLTYLPLISESNLSSVVTTKLAYANTINGYFTAGKLNEVNAADALKNSNVTKASIGLQNVEDVSPTQIREGITVDANGILQGIGTNNIPVNINKSRVNSLIASSNVLLVGNSAKKTGGSSWNEQVYSKDGYSGGAYFSITMDQTTFMVGLNTDPETNASWNSIDYAWYAAGTTLSIYENGYPQQSFLNSLSSGDVLSITYDGDKIRYFHNGTLKRTVTVAITSKLFFDSSFGSDNASFSNIQFGPMTSVAESLTNAATAQSTADAASDTATTVRGFFDTETTPQLKDSNTPAGLKNSNLSLSLNGTSLTLTNGGGSSLTLGKANVGLPNVDNVSEATIRSNVFSNNTFTTVQNNASNALTNAATAQNTADTANLLANTIEGRFTSGKLNEANAADALKNSNVTKTSIGLGNVANESPATIRSGITVDANGILQGIGTNNIEVKNSLITKTSIGLGNVANESPATIRSGITVTNGVLNGIGTADIVVDNSSISLTTDPASGEITLNKGVDSAITVNPFASTTFNTVSSTATSAQTAAGNAQTAAEAAQATADDAEAEIGSLEVTGSPNIPGAIFLKSSRGQLGGNITATQLLLGELVNQSPYKIRKSIKNLVLGNTLYTREIAELDVSIFEELSNIDTLEWASSTASQVRTAQTAPYIGTKFLTLRDGDSTKQLRWLQYTKEITGSCTIKCRVLKSSTNGTRYDPTGLNLEYPDSGENLVIQTSTDGTNWTTHTTLMQGATSTQTVYTSTVIDNINDPYFVRIKQINYSNSSSDHYAINDISIESNTYDTDLEPAISSIATTVAANQISNKQPRTVFLYDADITITEPTSYRIIDARTQATSRTIYISDIVLTGIGTEIEIIFSKNSGVKAADITLSISPALSLIYPNQIANPVSSYAIYENKRFICSSGLYLV